MNKSKMMRQYYRLALSCLLLMTVSWAMAQNGSHWQCDIYGYRYDMTVCLTLEYNGAVAPDLSDYEVAAFVGEECRGVAVAEYQARHGVSHAEGQQARQQTEDEEMARALPHALQVHLQAGKEHDVVEAHLTENLKRRPPCQHVQPVGTYGHARQHHAYDMGDAQLAHHYRRKQDDKQHHEEYQRGVFN